MMSTERMPHDARMPHGCQDEKHVRPKENITHLCTGLPDPAWVVDTQLSTAGLMAISAMLGFFARSVLLSLSDHEGSSLRDSSRHGAILDMSDFDRIDHDSNFAVESRRSALGKRPTGVASSSSSSSNGKTRVAEQPRAGRITALQTQPDKNPDPEVLWAAAWQAFDAPTRGLARQRDRERPLSLQDRLLGRPVHRGGSRSR